jgi:hypothetical protein
VGVGLGVGESTGFGVELGAVVGSRAVVAVACATGVPLSDAPGLRISTMPTKISPIKQNASKMISGIANLRLANMSRSPSDILPSLLLNA